MNIHPIHTEQDHQDALKAVSAMFDSEPELPSYGYRRVWELLRRVRETQLLPAINVKRVYRVHALRND